MSVDEKSAMERIFQYMATVKLVIGRIETLTCKIARSIAVSKDDQEKYPCETPSGGDNLDRIQSLILAATDGLSKIEVKLGRINDRVKVAEEVKR